MTISATTSKDRYSGNGVTTEFPYTFRILDASHLVVMIADSEDVSQTLVKDTHYTLTGVDEDAGGTVTTLDLSSLTGVVSPVLPTGWSITIYRSVPLKQLTDLENQGGFYPNTVEEAFDYLTMATQQLQEQMDRSYTVTITSGETGSALDANINQLVDDAGAAALAAAASASSASGSANAASVSAAAALGSENAAALSESTASAAALSTAGSVITATHAASDASGFADSASLAAASVSGTLSLCLDAQAAAERSASDASDSAGSAAQSAIDAAAASHVHDNFAVLEDITDAGSGAIITVAERANLHAHSNKTQLDKIGESGGNLTYDGSPIATAVDVSDIQKQILYLLFRDNAGYSPIPGCMFDTMTDQTGVNDVTSTNEEYSASNDMYYPTASATTQFTNTLTTDSGAWNDNTIRQVIPASAIADSGSKVRITLQAGAAEGLTIDHVSIVERSSTSADGVTTPTEIKFGGVSGVAIPAGSSAISDTTTFTVDDTKDYLLIMDIGSSASVDTMLRADTTGWTLYYKAATDSWNATSLAGSTTIANRIHSVQKLEIVSSTVSNMTLFSEEVTAEAEPSTGFLAIAVEPTDNPTINTDLRGYASKDGGTTWDEVTLALAATVGTTKLYMGEVALTSSGTTMKIKATTHNNKNFGITAWGLAWRE